VDDVRGTVRRLEPELTNTVRSARQSFDSVNEILTPENRKLVTEMLKNINGLASTVIKITASLNTLLDSTEKTVKNIDTFVLSSGEVVADVRAITKPLALRSETLVTSITESADQLSKTLADVRLLLKSFGNGNGSLQKLLGDPNLYQNLDEASASLARVMARTEKIMRDLEVFADKIARRPELIGVGGALRPSSGLKDAPNASFPSYRPDWPPALPARALEPTWLLPPAAPPALAPPPPSMPTDPSTPLPPVQGYPVR
jgi:phospholipid/cholesterol/gamma-HCH transport system substrate-binding protein